MGPHTDDGAEPPALAALVILSLGAIPIVVLIALLAGLSWPVVAVLAACTPTVMALLFAGAMLILRGRRTQQTRARAVLADTTLTPDEARERRLALHVTAHDVEQHLAALRRGASDGEVDELFPLLSELHNLRLQLAETVLRSSGELPPTLQEQLLAEHRQFLALLHAWRSRHGRRGGATG